MLTQTQNNWKIIYYELFKKNQFPIGVTYEFTTRCNFNCIHCFRNSYKHEDELTLKEWKRITGELKERNTLIITITGGEPLTRKEELIELLAYLQENRFQVKLKSNGYFIDKETAFKLKEVGIAQTSISFYSVKEEEFEAITKVKGSYNQVRKAIDNLLEVGVKVSLSIVIMKHNFNSWKETIRFAEKTGVDWIIDPIIRSKLTGEPTEDLKLSPEELSSIYKELPEDEVFKGINNPHDDNIGLCNGILTSFCIKANGDVWPCQPLNYNLGSILKNNLHEIWNSEKATRLRNLKWKELPTCSKCKILSYCNGRCSAEAMLRTKRVIDPDPIACEKTKLLLSLFKERYPYRQINKIEER